MTSPVQQTNNNAQEIVVGVDTHKDFHVAAVLSAAGVLLGTRSFPATADGYRNLVSWVTGSGCCAAREWRAPARTAPG